MSKHTPGPWRVVRKNLQYVIKNDHQRDASIQIVYGTSPLNIPWYGTEEQAKANAQLIATAPKLLEAAKAYIHALDNELDRADAIEALEDAIAKATEEQR